MNTTDVPEPDRVEQPIELWRCGRGCGKIIERFPSGDSDTAVCDCWEKTGVIEWHRYVKTGGEANTSAKAAR